MNLTYNSMQNKQLQRELKVIVQNLKSDQITRIIDVFEKQEGIYLHKNFTKSGLNCTCCTLTHQQIVATGFGRNQQQALVNAAKIYLETLITTNTLVPQLKIALKQHKQELTRSKAQDPLVAQEDTLQLQERDLNDVSQIKQGCTCVYFQIHEHHLTEIKNLEARMKLIMRQNQMLKELLLAKEGKSLPDKENKKWRANV